MVRALNVIVCIVTIAIPAGVDAREAVHITGPTMGTTYGVILPAAPSAVPRERLRAEIDSLLATIDEKMSTYRDDSEIARFNVLPDAQVERWASTP